MSSLALIIKRACQRLIAWIVSLILTPETINDSYNFILWEKHGYHITPDHYYHPIPNTHQLEKYYSTPSLSQGIDFRQVYQLKLLQEIIPKYSREFNNFPLKQEKPNSFFLHNDGFCGIDPHVYHSFIRHFKPDTIIEIGSGHSTLLGYQAISLNNSGSKLIVIDPWPKDFIHSFISQIHPGLEYIPCKVEELDTHFFSLLKENDILFIDSSHVIRTGGDICFLILEVLPSLPSGVLIHFHDIYLPSEYPREIILEQHMFWTEQYLLQAYLTENDRVEVLFASNYMSHEHKDIIKTTFPNAIWWIGASFWIRKCYPSNTGAENAEINFCPISSEVTGKETKT